MPPALHYGLTNALYPPPQSTSSPPLHLLQTSSPLLHLLQTSSPPLPSK